MSVPKRAHFMLSVADLARAAAFYRDGLDLHLALESPRRCELKCGGARIVLLPGGANDGDGARRETALALEVENLEAAVARAIIAGATLESQEEGSHERRAQICDTEGNLIYLVEPLRRWA
jgi:predicted enzyme related to lactoylglutathione lyase